MDGFLVIGRTNLDDVPLRLFKAGAEAERFAMDVTGETVYAVAEGIMEIDCAGLCNVAIVQFLDGIPVKLEIVKQLPDD